MNHFDYNKYLQNNPLLKEADSLSEVSTKSVQASARKFVDAMKAYDPQESQIQKFQGSRYFVVAVPEKNFDKAQEAAAAYKKENSDELKAIKASVRVTQSAEGRKTLWPADNKKFFDIK